MHDLHFLFTVDLYFYYYISIEADVEVGGCICVILYVFEEMGVPGGSACSTYMYDFLVFTLVGIYANMAEMPGVRQTNGSCPIFLKIIKLFLNYKMNFRKLTGLN